MSAKRSPTPGNQALIDQSITLKLRFEAGTASVGTVAELLGAAATRRAAPKLPASAVKPPTLIPANFKKLRRFTESLVPFFIESTSHDDSIPLWVFNLEPRNSGRNI
jgi:hypothetical protein